MGQEVTEEVEYVGAVGFDFDGPMNDPDALKKIRDDFEKKSELPASVPR